MKNYLTFVFLLFLITPLLIGQTSISYTSNAESDPEARILLNKIQKKYDAFKTLEADFTLTIEIPEEPADQQNGKLVQKDDKYRLELAGQEIFCDGETLWFYLKNNDEVQINNVEEESEDFEMLSPNDLLRIYEREDFVYVLANAYTENGQPLQDIEFKPLDKDSEYTKMRLTLNQRENEVVSIKVFSKDGSRFTLAITNLTPDKNYPDSYFVFNPANYPGVYVEDLRMD